ncbi:hypothetical protein Lpp46_0664 [Lacticaseibacillus paracasei subsp. paracasei Lpp46]|nr:hypothetical protein Lpp46_0664 [Lacticaseibacillus paracasei subsp. paracasei Lpp46]
MGTSPMDHNFIVCHSQKISSFLASSIGENHIATTAYTPTSDRSP